MTAAKKAVRSPAAEAASGQWAVIPAGESATWTTLAGASFGPKDPYLSRKSSGTPTTITRSASARAIDRARVTSSEWPRGSTPRACPLVITGSDSASAHSRAAVSAPPSHTSEPSTSTGRRAARSSVATAATSSASGGAAAGMRPASGGRSTVSAPKIASSGKSQNTGPRCGVSASRNASSTDPATPATACSVQARLVTGASSGTWSISCSAPLPHR